MKKRAVLHDQNVLESNLHDLSGTVPPTGLTTTFCAVFVTFSATQRLGQTRPSVSTWTILSLTVEADKGRQYTQRYTQAIICTPHFRRSSRSSVSKEHLIGRRPCLSFRHVFRLPSTEAPLQTRQTPRPPQTAVALSTQRVLPPQDCPGTYPLTLAGTHCACDTQALATLTLLRTASKPPLGVCTVYGEPPSLLQTTAATSALPLRWPF
jgi:hypothetical protein